MKTKQEKAVEANRLLDEAWDNMDERHCGTAVPKAESAIAIYQSLAIDDPTTFDPMLADAYNTLSMAYAFMHRPDEAEDTAAKALFFAGKT